MEGKGETSAYRWEREGEWGQRLGEVWEDLVTWTERLAGKYQLLRFD